MTQKYVRPDRTVDRFDADATRSYTLAANYYIDADILAREQEAIFWQSWVCIGHASDVGEVGQYLAAEIVGQQVFAIRSSDGQVRAFFNVCMHRGHSLLEGKGTVTSRITCPYHAWAYDTVGRLMGARMSDRMDDFEFDDFQLPQVAIEEFGGFVFVNLSSNPTSMSDTYPGAEEALLDLYAKPAELHQLSSSTFDIAANWKNVGDNLLECYHCHPAHPAFVELIDMDTYRNETYENWSIQTGTARPRNDTYDVAPGKPQEFSTLFLWPNLAIGRLPATEGLLLFQFAPTAPERTLQTTTVYAPPDCYNSGAAAADDYFNNVLGPEDVALVENVQLGLRSLGYHQGRFICIPDRPEISEHAVHHFHAMVREALE